MKEKELDVKNEVKKTKLKKSTASTNKTAADKEKKKSPQKKKTKKTTEGKKIIPKKGTADEAILIAKSRYKKTLEVINVVENITPEQHEQFLLAIAMGLVPDKFGLEAGLDTRLKALDQYQKLQQQKQQNADGENGNEEVVIIDDIG